MAQTQPNLTDEINKLYDSNLATGKAQLEQDYNAAISDLEAQKRAAQQQTQKYLTRTAVESQQAQKNYNEVQTAYGLSSGAMAQARLAQDNQLQADLTAIRTAQQTADDGIERERTLLSQQYAAAIRQAQADNDLARAEALYQEAARQEEQLLARQQQAAQALAGAGDYSLFGTLYGLTPEQVKQLESAFVTQPQETSKVTQPQETKTQETKTQETETITQTGSGYLATLKNMYPGGVVKDQSHWNYAVSQYGEDALAAAGFRYEPEPEAEPVFSYSSIESDVRQMAAGGVSQQELAQYLEQAVALGYINRNQAAALKETYKTITNDYSAF